MRKLAVMVLAMTFLGVAPGQSLEKIRTGGALLKNCEQFDVVARSRDALESAWALLRLHWAHPDFLEGPRAFAEKREPRWNPDPNARSEDGE